MSTEARTLMDSLDAVQTAQMHSHYQHLHIVQGWTRDDCRALTNDLAELSTQPDGLRHVADYLAASAVVAHQQLTAFYERAAQ